MNHILPHIPDDPGPDHGPLTFRDYSPGVTRIYWGGNLIGDIVQSSWGRLTTLHKVTLYLGMPPLKDTASNLTQAKVFARQKFDEFFARTPVKLEVR